MVENSIRLLSNCQKNKGVFESPTPLSATFKDAKKFDIENPILGNLLTQVIANQVNDK